jgi:hypothetical protein
MLQNNFYLKLEINYTIYLQQKFDFKIYMNFSVYTEIAIA